MIPDCGGTEINNSDYEVFEADTLRSAVNLFKKEQLPLICLDMGLENQAERGMEIIDNLISLNRHIKIIVIT